MSIWHPPLPRWLWQFTLSWRMSNNFNLSVSLKIISHIPLPLTTGGHLTNYNYSLVRVVHSSESWLLYTTWVLILIPLLKSPCPQGLLWVSTTTILLSWNPVPLILHLRPLQTGPDPLLGFISNYPLFKSWLQRSCSLEFLISLLLLFLISGHPHI